jgi:hypothetical protein
LKRSENISQPSMLSSNPKKFALRTRYKRSRGMGDRSGVCWENAEIGRKMIISPPVRNSASLIRGAAPETPRFIAVAPESLYCFGAARTAPAIPASGSTLGSHLCVALSSAQTLSEWKTSTQPCNDSSLNGEYPLHLLSHSKGSLQLPSSSSARGNKPAFRRSFNR